MPRGVGLDEIVVNSTAQRWRISEELGTTLFGCCQSLHNDMSLAAPHFMSLPTPHLLRMLIAPASAVGASVTRPCTPNIDSTKKLNNLDNDTTTTRPYAHYFPPLPSEMVSRRSTEFCRGEECRALAPAPEDKSCSREENTASDAEEYPIRKRTASGGKPVSARALLARNRFPPLLGSHTMRTTMPHLSISTPDHSHSIPCLSGSASRKFSRVGSEERLAVRYAGQR